MDKLGPMARTAEDCGLILAAIAGHDRRDRSSLPGRFAFRPNSAEGRQLRLGILPKQYEGVHPAPDTQVRFEAALEVLRGLGHRAEQAMLPDYPYDVAASTIIAAEGASAFESLILGPRLAELADETQRQGLRDGLALPAVDYLRAMRVRTLAGPAAVTVFERVDVLVAPTLLRGAPLVDADLRESFGGMGGNGGPGNLLGWPSISVPMGLGSDGLPLGLELIGPPEGEAVLLALAAAYQRETSWHLARPPR